MGADITFENGEYFRDSYNDSNLAWVKGMSYWSTIQAGMDKEEFMRQLSQITDEEIEEYVDKLSKGWPERGIPRNEPEKLEEEKRSHIKMFKEKRDFLKHLDEKGELKVDDDGWSV